MNLKAVAKQFLPPILTDRLRRPTGMEFVEGYSSFAEAAADSTSYEDPSIVEATRERTTGILRTLDRSPPLIVASRDQQMILGLLLLLQSRHASSLSVLDFGGSLGQHYAAFRAAFPDMTFTWHVVETAASAEAGRKLFASDDRISFFTALDQALPIYDVVLTSGALQYLPTPADAFRAMSQRAKLGMVLNRAPLGPFGDDFVTLQKPTTVYTGARIPVWFFARQKWLALMSHELNIRAEWITLDDGATLKSSGLRIPFNGFALSRP